MSARSGSNFASTRWGSGKTTSASSGFSMPRALAPSSALSEASRICITLGQSRSISVSGTAVNVCTCTQRSSCGLSARYASSAVWGRIGASSRHNCSMMLHITVCVDRRRGESGRSQYSRSLTAAQYNALSVSLQKPYSSWCAVRNAYDSYAANTPACSFALSASTYASIEDPAMPLTSTPMPSERPSVVGWKSPRLLSRNRRVLRTLR